MPEVKPSGYDITPLGESLLASQRSRNDERAKVARNRKKRADRAALAGALVGTIGNAMLRSSAEKFSNSEPILNEKLRNRRVLDSYQKDLELKEALDKDPDYLKNQYMTRMMEQVAGENPNLEAVSTERIYAPLARAKADEDEKFLQDRLVLGKRLHTMSGGDPDFYERELTKHKPKTIKSWLSQKITGDRDRDTDTIQRMYSDRLKEYEHFVSLGVSRDRSLEILENLKDVEVPQDMQIKFREVQIIDTDRFGNTTKRTEKRPYFVNKQGQLVAPAQEKKPGERVRPVNKNPKVSQGQREPFRDRDIPDHDAHAVVQRAKRSVPVEQAEAVEKAYAMSHLSEDSTEKQKMALTRTKAGILIRLDDSLSDLGIENEDVREQLAAQMFTNNALNMYSNINDTFDRETLTGVDMVHDGTEINAIFALGALEDMRNYEINTTNPEALEEVENRIISTLGEKGALVQIQKNTDQETLEILFDKVVNKQEIFNANVHYPIIGEVDSNGEQVVSSPNATLRGYLNYMLRGAPPERFEESPVLSVKVPKVYRESEPLEIEGFDEAQEAIGSGVDYLKSGLYKFGEYMDSLNLPDKNK